MKNFIAGLLFPVVISKVIQNKLFTKKKKGPSHFAFSAPCCLTQPQHKETFNQHSYTCQQTLSKVLGETLSISDLFQKELQKIHTCVIT